MTSNPEYLPKTQYNSTVIIKYRNKCILINIYIYI